MEYLDSTTIQLLNDELSKNQNSDAWGPHSQTGSIKNNYQESYVPNGPLRHGKTAWIRSVTDNLNLIHSLEDFFPQTSAVFKTLSSGNDFGRCYWHTLTPGTCIDRHIDRGLYFNSVLKRYQIYLDIPDGVSMFFNNTNQDPKKIQNSLVELNYSLPHFYKNDSNVNFTFAVIDVLKSGIHVIK